MLTLAVVFLLVLIAATGIGSLAWLYSESR